MASYLLLPLTSWVPLAAVPNSLVAPGILAVGCVLSASLLAGGDVFASEPVCGCRVEKVLDDLVGSADVKWSGSQDRKGMHLLYIKNPTGYLICVE